MRIPDSADEFIETCEIYDDAMEAFCNGIVLCFRCGVLVDAEDAVELKCDHNTHSIWICEWCEDALR